MIQQVLVFF